MKANRRTSQSTAELTLGDHLRELQGRFFSTAIVFVLIAAAAYPFFGQIADWLLAPLKEGQDLVYLTPGGAIGFMLTVCLYVGLIGTLPLLIYHIYGFLMPAVRQSRLRTVLAYTIASLILAISGVLFAYYVSLPAALHFLTSFELNHINPMLTIDSYISFIMTYMLAGAALFQVPLVMMIINSVKPLPPKKLMSYQRHIILASFIIAAVISPTPDALNQTLLASPLIVMYQIGIIIVWRINARANKRAQKTTVRDRAENYRRREITREEGATPKTVPRSATVPAVSRAIRTAQPAPAPQVAASARHAQVVKKPVMDVMTTSASVVGAVRQRPIVQTAQIAQKATLEPQSYARSASLPIDKNRSMDIMQQRQTMRAHAQASRANALLTRQAPSLIDSLNRSRPVVPVRGTVDGMVRA